MKSNGHSHKGRILVKQKNGIVCTSLVPVFAANVLKVIEKNLFESEGFDIIHAPFQTPNANAHAERWVRMVREECLDHILIISAAHLQRILLEFVQYYNAARPHQGIEQQMPIPSKTSTRTGSIQCRKVLGGIINNYYRSSDSRVPATLG